MLQFAVAASITATSVIPITDTELRDRSELIVRGTVIASQTVDCDGVRTCTRTAIAISESFKGQPSESPLVLIDTGGLRADGSGFQMWGRAQYVPGREVVVFAVAREDGRLQTAQMLLGKFDVMSDENGRRFAVPDLVSSARRDVDVLEHLETSVPVSTSGPRFLPEFSAFLRDEAPPARALSASSVRSLRHVELVPRNRLLQPEWQVAWNARWVFGSAQWKLEGTEALAEARKAMSTWNGHSDSNVNYVENASGSNVAHLGASNVSVCGGWSSCGTTGVVGCGGPSISSSMHSHRGESFNTIVGGEVWIRCGLPNVSLALAESVILHEFGHTLGLGHSDQGTSPGDVCPGDENSAVMKASVSASNPKTSLQSDDRDAAKWLYGSGAMSCGSPTPTPTPTPSPSPSPTPTPTPTPSPSPTPSTLSAKFSVSPTGGVATQTLFKFTDQSTGNPVVWSWSFGDGISSNLQSPAHMYSQAGTYTVKLTVANSGGTQSTATKSVTVTAPSLALQAAFSYSPESATTDTTIQFYDQSSGNPSSWNWNFGDGTTSIMPNPAKKFAAPGVYSVSLTVRAGPQSSGASRTVSVAAGTPATPPAVADFTISNAHPKANEDVFFTDVSTGNPTSWGWDFGDGSTSNARNPVHRYAAAGTYSVSLIAANTNGPSAARVRSITVDPMIERFQSLVPVTAQTSGVGSTYWRTELTVFNYGDSTVTVDFRFVPGSGGATLSRSMPVAAGGTLVFQNALPDLFGLGAGAGAVAVEAQAPGLAPRLRVSSRTFTGGADGTYGQYVPDVEMLPAVSYLAGIVSNANYRTNVGFVNRTGADVGLTVTLFDADGTLLGTMPVTVPANNYQQQAITALFPLLAGRDKSGMSMKIEATAADAVTAYASTIDNRSQDPIFYPAMPLATSQEILIPGIARIPGAEGTFWRTDVAFFNPTGVTMTLNLRFLAAGRDNRGVSSRSLPIGPGRTVTIEDMLTWLGTGDGSGALLVSASGAGTAPIVTARTYTTRATDGGTYGQWIEASEVSLLERSAVVTGVRSDDSYRTNIGFANSGDQPLNVAVSVHGAFGQNLGTGFVQVPPKSQVQVSLANLLPGLNVAAVGSFTIRAEGDASSLLAYASMIDNRSGDPIFVKGR